MQDIHISFQQYGLFKACLPHRTTMIRWMSKALEKPAEITVRFVDEEEGKLLNETYRQKAYATNVLTWDYSQDPIVCADIAICVPVVVRQAQEQNKTFKEHLAHLLIHGVLHAQGYDHLDEQEAEEMEAKETQLMLSLKMPNPYSDRVGMVHD